MGLLKDIKQKNERRPRKMTLLISSILIGAIFAVSALIIDKLVERRQNDEIAALLNKSHATQHRRV